MKAAARHPDTEAAARERLSVVVVGHVDHGKSTLIGRLLADTGSLPEGKLEELAERCARNAKPLEYAYLLDALKDEQSQGITIDTARCFFKTAERDYIIIDAPGHIEFLKNMVTGAARADAALLVIDAREGVQENSRRHGYFLSMLGIEQFVVGINKMDLVDYRAEVFEQIAGEYRAFLAQVGLEPLAFVPLNAQGGDNVATRSARMPWYEGPAVLELMGRFRAARTEEHGPLRLPVQDVYKFTALGDDRRIVAGRVESGVLRCGDGVLFLPSGKRAKVKRIEVLQGPAPAEAGAGVSTGFTTTEQIYITRGELVCREDQPLPQVSSRLRVDLFWLGRQPLDTTRACTFKLGSAEVPAHVEAVIRVLDASNLAVDRERTEVRRHEVAECILRTRRPVAFDLHADVPRTGRFVLVDQYAIAGGGIIREALADGESELRQEALHREGKWVRSAVTPEMRAERYAQRAAVLVISGVQGTGRKELARSLEEHLFRMGRMVYYLGMGSVVHGLDTDLRQGGWQADRAGREHIRRLGEVLHLLLDTGLIVICTAVDLARHDLQDIETLVRPAPMIAISIGPARGGLEPDLQFEAPCDVNAAVPQVVDALHRQGILPEM